MALTEKELQKYLKQSTAKSKISGGYGKMFRNAERVSKFKLERNSEQTLLIPLSIALPFNPFDLEDESYSKLNPFFMGGSVEKAWEILQQLCEVSKDLKPEIESAIGSRITDAEWSMRGEDMCKLLKSVRKIDFKSDYTVKIDISSFNQYATRRRIDSSVDAAGMVKFSGLLYELSKLEQELIAPEMKQLNDKLKKGGELEHLTKQQKSIKRREVAAKACLSRPALFNCYRILHIPIVDNVPSDEDKRMLATNKLVEFEKWDKIDKDRLELYLSKLGGKYDKCPSYVEFRIIGGGEEDPLSLFQNAQKSIAQAEPLHTVVPEFYEEYLKYRDDDEHWKDETLLKSIPELKNVDDNELLTHYENNLNSYDLSLFRQEIVQKYGEVIKRVSPTKYTEIVEMVNSGMASDEVVPEDDVTVLLKPEVLDENGEVDVEASYGQEGDDNNSESNSGNGSESNSGNVEITQQPKEQVDSGMSALEKMSSNQASEDNGLGVQIDVSGII